MWREVRRTVKGLAAGSTKTLGFRISKCFGATVYRVPETGIGDCIYWVSTLRGTIDVTNRASHPYKVSRFRVRLFQQKLLEHSSYIRFPTL